MILIKDKLLDKPELVHAFTSRSGGVSKFPFNSLNCCNFVENENSNALQNRNLVLKKLNLSSSIQLKQIHSNKVVKAEDILDNNKPIEADAITSNTIGLPASVTIADCAAILFADTKINMIAAAHAGWRGAVLGITDNVIQEFLNSGSRTENICAVIGPCINQNSFEVREDMRDLAIKTDINSQKFFIKTTSSFLFNLPGYILYRLKKMNLSKISFTGEDTYTNPKMFFSHRYQKHNNQIITGRMMGIIGLKEKI